ncbi:MAG TPA: ABC transporter ATP-binding protein [Acidimicrobiia bacterium]|jgi:ABC-2 type transport system ATP-binding protein
MIETRGLVKRYGSVTALDGVDLAVARGAVYGLVGRNGAGKTTLLGILAGLRSPTSGSVAIAVARDDVAVLPDTPRFDPWLTGREVVSLAAHLTSGDAARVEAVIAEAGLADDLDRAVRGYSRGMLQRLGVACTVVGSPQVVLLDEPASALDPLGRREVLDLIGRLRGSATVLFSSHILGDVQEVCDTVGILDEGNLVFQGPLEDLLVGSAVPRYLVRCRPPIEPVMVSLRDRPWVVGVDPVDGDRFSVMVASLDDAEVRLARALAEAGARVISFAPEAVTLEQAFLELTR